MLLFDTHTHLNDGQFAEDQAEVIARAQAEHGVGTFLNVGFNRETIPSTLQLAEKYPFIYAAVGWHPNDAKDFHTEEFEWIKALANHSKVVAIGEIGLDYYWDYSPVEQQQAVFRQQIGLARDVKLPVIIHCREAYPDVVRILQEENAHEVGGVMHCFGGEVETMQQCLDLDFMIGLGGPVTFKNAKLAKEIAREVPLSSLLIETDCPYLAPHPYRGKRNETGYVRLVAEEIAHLKGITFEEVAKVTTKNGKRLFGI